MKYATLVCTVLIVQIVNLSGGYVIGQRQAAAGREKKIAVTIDDLPLNGPSIGIARLRRMTDRMVTVIKVRRVPAVGFVNESLLYRDGEIDGRIAALRAWSDAGIELGNHTFSHLGFKGAALASYEDDFIRGDSISRMLAKRRGRRPRYFRHPFLQMADTAELEKSFENFIAERGYRIAPVTVDTLDWMFLPAYAEAAKEGNAAMLRRVSDEYLTFAGRKLDFSEKAAADLFERPIPQILLLHANELNAANLNRLLTAIENRGYKFITLDEALKDPAYRNPEKYSPTSDWLLQWSASRGKKLEPPAPADFIVNIYNKTQN